MTTEELVYKKIEEIYNSEKGKGFITHLIRSFFPIHRANFMFAKDDKKEMVCAITKKKLISKEDVMKLTLENKEKIFENLADRIQGKNTENILSGLFEGKLLAIECENSTKLLSPVTYRQLYNFITSEMLKGNKHINFVVSDEIKKESKKENKTKSSSSLASHTSVNQPKKEQEKKVIHKSTTKLGDMDSLIKLKEKLEKEGK